MHTIKLRTDVPSQELRNYAKHEKDARLCKRLLAIANLIDTNDRLASEKIACLSNSNFRIWIKRFNEEGIEGLMVKKQTGRPQKLTKEIKDSLREKVLNGPNEKDGLCRYRICDLQDFLKEEHDIKMGSSGIWYILQSLKLTWKTGRQRHPKSSDEVQETFKKTSKTS